MRGFLTALACRLGVAWLLRRLKRRRLLVLMYHGVVEEPLAPFCWHQLPLAEFRAQIDWVAGRFNVLPLDEALARLADGTLPANACAITFDDGYRSNVALAEPILEERGLSATVFLPTDAITKGRLLWPDRSYLALTLQGAGSAKIAWTLDQLKAMPRAKKDARVVALTARTELEAASQARAFRLLDWGEVRAARERGVLSFGPHATTHEILSRCEDDEVRRQVQGSVDALRKETGVEATVFAYPNGRAQDFDDRARAALQEAGVRFALTTMEGRNGRDADLLALRRCCVGADTDLATFKLAASGWTDR